MCSCILGACLCEPRRRPPSPAINGCGGYIQLFFLLSLLGSGWSAAPPWHQQCGRGQRVTAECQEPHKTEAGLSAVAAPFRQRCHPAPPQLPRRLPTMALKLC